jgi:hypothetical protein
LSESGGGSKLFRLAYLERIFLTLKSEKGSTTYPGGKRAHDAASDQGLICRPEGDIHVQSRVLKTPDELKAFAVKFQPFHQGQSCMLIFLGLLAIVHPGATCRQIKIRRKILNDDTSAHRFSIPAKAIISQARKNINT